MAPKVGKLKPAVGNSVTGVGVTWAKIVVGMGVAVRPGVEVVVGVGVTVGPGQVQSVSEGQLELRQRLL
ncbi:hypothetical protein FJZ41_01930 [Candidatus Shapirobacteria bacterium]|nr:hypothetical protein [Candidatus Shapirobacteria bacterium]